MSNGYFEIEQIKNEIFPVFIKLFDQIWDNEDGLHLLTKMLGNFIFEIGKFDKEFVQSNAEQICKFFDTCVKSEDPTTRYNCAYNLPCVFDMFADFAKENPKCINFSSCIKNLTKNSDENENMET